MLLHDCWGDGSDHQCWKVRYMNTGRSRQALYFCRRARVLKKRVQRSKDSPYLSLTQVMGLSPSHPSGQGAHSSLLANLKQIVTGRRGKGEGVAGGRLRCNWSKAESPRFPLIEKTSCYFPRYQHSTKTKQRTRIVVSLKKAHFVKNLPNGKLPGGEFYQTFQEELVPILCYLIKIEGNTPKLILRGQCYPDVKTKDGTKMKMKNYR